MAQDTRVTFRYPESLVDIIYREIEFQIPLDSDITSETGKVTKSLGEKNSRVEFQCPYFPYRRIVSNAGRRRGRKQTPIGM